MKIENKVKVTICGKEYNLRTDETPDYLLGLAARVDKEINDLIKAKPNFGVQNAAVFVALTSLDEAKKAADSIDNIRSRIKTYVDDAAKARSAKDKLSAEVKELKAKVAQLEKDNKELKKKLSAFDCEQLVLENTISPSVTIYAGTDRDAKADNAPIITIEPTAEGASSGGQSTESGEKDSTQQESQEQYADGIGKDDGKAAADASAPQGADLTAGKPQNQGNKQSRSKRKRR